MNSELVLLALGIGLVAGLRAMTAPAVVSWFAHLHAPNLQGSPWGFMGSTPAVVLFTVLAAAELVTDKLPRTPSRTRPGPLVARIVTGALSGGTLCAAGGASAVTGAIVGAIGAIAGTFGGYLARTRSVRRLHAPDFLIALLEDVVAVGGAVLLVSRL